MEANIFWWRLRECLLLQRPAIKIWEVWHFVFLEFGKHSPSNILTLHGGVASAALPV